MQPPVLEIAVLATVADDHAVQLPIVRVSRDPDDQLLAPVQEVVRTQLGVDRPALELYVPEAPAGAGRIPALLVLEPGEPIRTRGTPAVAIEELPAPVGARARVWVEELTGHRPAPALRPAWARPGWTARITGWLD